MSQERLALSDSPSSSPLLNRNGQAGTDDPRAIMSTLRIPLRVPYDEDSVKANLVGGSSTVPPFPRDVRVPESDPNGEIPVPSILLSPPLSVELPPAVFSSHVHTPVGSTATSGDQFSYDTTQYDCSQSRLNIELPDAEAMRPRAESSFVAERHDFHQHPHHALEARVQRNHHESHCATSAHQLTAVGCLPLPGPSDATAESLTHEAYSAGPSCINQAISPIHYSPQFQHTPLISAAHGLVHFA